MISVIHRETEQKPPSSPLAPAALRDDSVEFEQSLRPKTLSDYIGQAELKRNLNIFLQAAKKRGDTCEHLLFHGPAGLGKTTLAIIIANELGVSLKITSGPALERAGDLAAILTNLQQNELLFIDEIHRLRPTIEEVLYSAMEDFAIDIVLGKGPAARSVRINLPKFTLVGATTKVSALSSPLRDRFGIVHKLNFYELDEIEKIIGRSASILKMKIDDTAARLLARSCRKTPRIANRLLKRVRDYVEVHGGEAVTTGHVQSALKNLGVDELGLDATDREIIKTLIEKFGGGPVGLNTISSALAEEEATIEEVYEPYLLQLGFLERTARGRKVTQHGYRHLGLESLFEKQQILSL